MSQQISAANTAQYVGSGRWNWTIYIIASPADLERVRCVQYTLHPTFPNPVQRVCRIGDRSKPFALSSNGWGTFKVDVEVELQDTQKLHFQHMLSFNPTQQTISAIAVSANNIARQIRPGLYEWTVYLEGAPDALARVQCVQYTLDPTFSNPVREVCERGSDGRAFPLAGMSWGTFRVGITIRLRDGSTQNLSHYLRF